MTRKQITIVGLLMVGCVAAGIVLATDWNRTPFGLAGPDVKLGAANAPVVPSNEVTAINNAFVAVSSAVTPQVVSITVTGKATTASAQEEPDIDDPMDMRRFFFGPAPDQPQRGSGSGVIVSPDGYILTNNHVVEGGVNGTVKVNLNDGREFDAKVIGRDSLTDLAVIKVEASDLPTATFGNSDDLKVGSLVLAVGNPLGLNYTVTQGIVSALGRGQLNLNGGNGYGVEDFIQTDAAINPGNSGGGLFNLKGELIGINSAIATRTGYYQGYGFAIPINLARAVAEDLIEDGRVNRGYIGVTIRSMDSKLARALGVPQGQGVLVSDIVKGGAGEAAGIKPNDVILEVDGQTVNTSNHLQSIVARRRAGDDVKLKIFRDGSTIEKTIRLKAREEYETVARRDDRDNAPGRTSPSANGAVDVPELDMSVRMLDSRTARERNVDYGVSVSNVQTYGEAFNEGIRVGDVIVSANKKPVKTPEDFSSIVSAASNGDIILLQLKRREGSTDLVAVEVKK